MVSGVEGDVVIADSDRSSGGGFAIFTVSQSMLLSNFLPSVKTGFGRLTGLLAGILDGLPFFAANFCSCVSSFLLIYGMGRLF